MPFWASAPLTFSGSISAILCGGSFRSSLRGRSHARPWFLLQFFSYPNLWIWTMCLMKLRKYHNGTDFNPLFCQVLSVCQHNKQAIIQAGGMEALAKHLRSDQSKITYNCRWDHLWKSRQFLMMTQWFICETLNFLSLVNRIPFGAWWCELGQAGFYVEAAEELKTFCVQLDLEKWLDYI